MRLFLFFREQYFQNALRFSGLSTSKMRYFFGSTKPGKIVSAYRLSRASAYRGRALHTHAFWKYCSRKNSQRLSLIAGERLSRASAPHSRILEVLFPEKTSPRRRESSGRERLCSSAGLILPFFIFLFFRVQYFHFFIFP
jgi:hypothetical protein